MFSKFNDSFRPFFFNDYLVVFSIQTLHRNLSYLYLNSNPWPFQFCWRDPSLIDLHHFYLWSYWAMWGPRYCVSLSHPLVFFHCFGVHAVTLVVHLLPLRQESLPANLCSWWSWFCPSLQLPVKSQCCSPCHVSNTLLNDLFNAAMSTFRLHQNSDKIKIERGVRQRAKISKRMFTFCLQDAIINKFNWESKAINIDSELLCQLDFEDVTILIV